VHLRLTGLRYYTSGLTLQDPRCNWFRIAICIWFHLLISNRALNKRGGLENLKNYFIIIGLLFNRIIIYELGSCYFTLCNQRKSVVPVHPTL